jgi:hypothetical protein
VGPVMGAANAVELLLAIKARSPPQPMTDGGRYENYKENSV